MNKVLREIKKEVREGRMDPAIRKTFFRLITIIGILRDRITELEKES
jgi:hypothetical protein